MTTTSSSRLTLYCTFLRKSDLTPSSIALDIRRHSPLVAHTFDDAGKEGRKEGVVLQGCLRC